MSRHIKSRSGCRVCKAKRLKCDETVPACRNCVNRGIACPGYRQVLRWSTKYEHPAPAEKKRGATGGSSRTVTAAAAAIPEFSELATAASQSIKPSSPPKAKAPPPLPTESTINFDAFDPFEPVVKTEAAPAGRQPLSQVPPVPPSQSQSQTQSQTQSVPASSLSPTPSHTSSHSSSSSSSSYGQHGPPVVPVLAKTGPTSIPTGVPTSASDPYSFAYSMPPTSSSLSAATVSPQSSMVSTAVNNWQLTTLGNSVPHFGPVEVLEDDTDKDHYTLELWQPERFSHNRRYQQQQLLLSTPARGLTLPGTSLVELWFSSVCGMWAAYDSPANPFRRLCSSLWSSNEAVFFSLQTMAAASLPKRPPSVSEIVMLAPQMSTQALIQELQELFGPDAGGGSSDGVSRSGKHLPHLGKGIHGSSPTGSAGSTKFPAGLLTSLFCMSSSLSWIDARQLGIQYLRNARSVIDLLDLRAGQLSADDRELLEFFRGCLLYEEMLRSIVTDDQEDIQALLDWSPPTAGDKTDLHLHAWAGVPIVLIGLFGKVMALCRRSRKVWRKTARATYQLLYQAMQDIQEGQALEAMLLAIEIPGGDAAASTSSSSSTSTSDAKLKKDIYKAAEAIRLSSLLQLYQTFPDLVSQHQQAPGQAGQTMLGPPSSGENNAPATGRWLLPLVLHIVDLLRSIPADSPMRCLQPLLCLCAGSALRVEATDVPAVRTTTSAVDLVKRQPPSLPDSSGFDFSTSLSSLSTADATYDTTLSTGTSTSAVHRARDTLRARLGKLEQNLPPRPITVARQLLETVWMTYDTETPPSRSHWLDIMAETNFESVFG